MTVNRLRLHRHTWAVAIVFLCAATLTLRADDGAAKPSSPKWEQVIRGFEASDKKESPPQNAVLFIGASGIARWKSLASDFPEYKVINRGFGGSQMVDSFLYADRVLIPYRPKHVVIQAGGNDLKAGKSPEQVAADFKSFVEKIRAKLPETRVSFLCIPPSPSRWDMRETQKKTNQLIKDYITAGKNMDYIDLWPVVLGADGKPRPELFVEDNLHPNAEGYKVWTAAIKPHLNKD